MRPADQLGQVQPLDVFHGQEARAVDLPGVHRADDVRVVHGSGGLHLAVEPGDGTLVPDVVATEQLDGNHAAQPGVHRLVDRPHAAFAEFLQQTVLAQLAGRREGFRRGKAGVAGDGLGGERLLELAVVRGLLVPVQEANPGPGDFVEQLDRLGGVLANLEGPQVGHPLVGRVVDGVGVVGEKRDSQQPVVDGRLLLRRNPEPGEVGIKPLGHDRPPVSSARAEQEECYAP